MALTVLTYLILLALFLTLHGWARRLHRQQQELDRWRRRTVNRPYDWQEDRDAS